MALVKSDDAEIMTFRTGGGCVSFFGLPFLCAGLFVMTSPIWAAGQKNPPPWFFMIPFGAVFAAVGAALVFGRAGVVIDRRLETAAKWWGLLVPMKTTEYSFSDFDQVQISREVRHSKNSTYTVFPVKLLGQKGAQVAIEDCSDAFKAHQLGEQVAKFLRLRLVDSTGGGVIVREADQLDESIRERAKRSREGVQVPERPAGARSIFAIQGNSISIEIPPLGFSLLNGISIVGALVMATFVYFVFLKPALRLGMPAFFRWVWLSFTGLFMLGPLLAALRHLLVSITRRELVEIDPMLLRVTTVVPGARKVTEIPSLELEELLIGNVSESGARGASFAAGGAILARSDKVECRFGVGLSEKELQWLKAVIEAVVSS